MTIKIRQQQKHNKSIFVLCCRQLKPKTKERWIDNGYALQLLMSMTFEDAIQRCIDKLKNRIRTLQSQWLHVIVFNGTIWHNICYTHFKKRGIN